MMPANARSGRAAGDTSDALEPDAPGEHAAPRVASTERSEPGSSVAGDSVLDDSPKLSTGQLRSYTRLGTTAVYRILEWDEELVRVEVISAPGLESGTTLSLTREAIRSMPVEVE